MEPGCRFRFRKLRVRLFGVGCAIFGLRGFGIEVSVKEGSFWLRCLGPGSTMALSFAFVV